MNNTNTIAQTIEICHSGFSSFLPALYNIISTHQEIAESTTNVITPRPIPVVIEYESGIIMIVTNAETAFIGIEPKEQI